MSEEELRMTLSYEEALKKYKELPKPVLGQDELVLLLLGLLDKPVNGRTVLMKELFLLHEELKNKVQVASPRFYPYKYGPFSSELLLVVELLERYDYISVKNRRTRTATKYMLTSKGRKAAKAVIERLTRILGEGYIEKLKQLRIGWDQLGHHGILNYVYKLYPEYREKSLLKEKYQPMDWGVSEA